MQQAWPRAQATREGGSESGFWSPTIRPRQWASGERPWGRLHRMARRSAFSRGRAFDMADSEVYAFDMANDEVDDREAPGSGVPAQSLTLFPLPPPIARAPRTHAPDPRRGARLREAERSQIVWGRIDLDATLPEDHPTRAIWLLLERLDLSLLYARIEARDESLAASVIDPKIPC